MTYADIYAREVHQVSREELLRRLIRERYGWARRDLNMTSDDDEDETEGVA